MNMNAMKGTPGGGMAGGMIAGGGYGI